MEIASGSAAMGALRVGLQVISNHRRPVIEFYYDLRNDRHPSTGIRAKEGMSPRADMFAAFSVANIGGIRAENVALSQSGTTNRFHADMSTRTGIVVPQMAPGQSIFLFRLDMHDLFPDDRGPGSNFTLVAAYDGPRTGINRAFRWITDFKGTKQYETKFVFDNDLAKGDVPPPYYS